MLAALRRQAQPVTIARALGRHRSTVCREVRRNSTRADGRYRAFTPRRERTAGAPLAPQQRFSAEDFALIDELLGRQWSPEQVADTCATRGSSSSATRPSTATSGGQARGRELYTHRAARAAARKRYGGLRQPRHTRRQAPDLGAAAAGRVARERRSLGG